MLYYNCSISTDPKVVGCSPQINDVCTSADFLKYKDAFRERNWGSDQFAAPDLSLAPRAKWTAFLSCFVLPVSLGLVVTEEAEDTVKRLSLPRHRWLPLRIHTKNKDIREVSIVNFGWGSELIDYPNSSFFEQITEETISLTSFAQWQEIVANSPTYMLIYPKELVLKGHLDFISIPGNAILLVSEEAKSKIELLGLSGLEFSPSNISVKLQ
jgi:hypothetical protein